MRSKRAKKQDSAADQVEPKIANAGGAPAWLQKDGLAIWNRLAPTLRFAKLLTEADTQTFARYCRNFARWLKMQKAIDKEGEFYESESNWGKLKRINPAFAVSDRLERQLLAAEDRFGLNPAERQRIMVARAQTGGNPDLFGGGQAKDDKRPDDPAAKPTPAAEPSENPIGLLN